MSNMGHSKHHQACGKNPVSSRQKLIRQLEANKPKTKKPKQKMYGSIRELMKGE